MAKPFYNGYESVAFGTAIVVVIPGVREMLTRVTRFMYETGGAIHTATFMRPVGNTTTVTQAQNGDSVLELASVDPGQTTAGVDETLAASDYLAWRDENETIQYGTVSSVSGDAVTLSAALSTDVEANADVWAFYELARTTHTQLKIPASATTTFNGPIQAGFSHQTGIETDRNGVYDPLILHIDNITATGKLHYLSAEYVDRTETTV